MASAGADKIKKKNEQNNLNMQTEEEKRDMFAKVKVDRGGTRAMVLLPGLSYNDFDRTGFKHLGISTCFSSALTAIWDHPDFVGNPSIIYKQNMMLFRIFTDREINHEMYRQANQKYLNFPLLVASEVSSFGKSSVTYRNTLVDRETGISLVKEHIGLCVVDGKTRKPSALPTEMISKIDKKHKGKGKILSLLDPPRECKVYTYEAIPGHSDTDRNQHVTQAIYLRYIMNGAAAALHSGFYSHFHDDILNYKVKSVRMMFQGESLPGDKLTLTTWEDQEKKFRLHFQIQHGSTKINRCTLDFSPKVLSKY